MAPLITTAPGEELNTRLIVRLKGCMLLPRLKVKWVLLAALFIIHTGVCLCLVTRRIRLSVLLWTRSFTCLRDLPVTTLPVERAALLTGSPLTPTSLLYLLISLDR